MAFDDENKDRSQLQESFESLQEFVRFAASFLSTWFLAYYLNPYIGTTAVGFIFLLSVSISGLFFSRLSVFILAILFALVHNFFFLPPLFSFSITQPADFFMHLMFLVTAAVTGQLTSLLKKKEAAITSREKLVRTLYKLTKELLKAKGITDVARVGARFIEDILGFEAVILVKEDDSLLSSSSSFELIANDKEKALAQWVFENGKPAGKFTSILPGSRSYYYPLSGKLGTIGILILDVDKDPNFSQEQKTLVENFANPIVSALDREIFLSKARSLDLYEESQKLYKTLLECVSHELKTPLATIKGCSSAILDSKVRSHEELVIDLAQEILVGSDRLQRIVDNLLDMSRIESGMLKVKIMNYSVGDLVEGAIHKLGSEVKERKITMDQVDRRYAIQCDPALTEQVLINLLINAHMYSPRSQAIEISSTRGDKFIRIYVRDHGPGLKPQDLPFIFTKFFRAHPEKTGGIGLGLAIVKNIIELQGGQVTAQNNVDGGAVFAFALPIGDDDVESGSSGH